MNHDSRWPVDGRFYLLLCRESRMTYPIASLELARCTYDDSVWNPEPTLAELKHLRPRCIVVQTLGNSFEPSNTPREVESACCISTDALSNCEEIKIGSLDGILSLHRRAADGKVYSDVMPDCISSTQRGPLLLPRATRITIASVGHAGQANRRVVERLFADCWSRSTNLTSDGMANMGSIREVVIQSPMPVRVYRCMLEGRIDFYFQRDGAPQVNMQDEVSMDVIAQSILPGGAPRGASFRYAGESMSHYYTMDRDLGNMYLAMLDFNGARRLTIRAYECLGPPLSYTSAGSGMGLYGVRSARMVFHTNPRINSIISEEDLSLVVGEDSHNIHNSVHGSYFPGYMMVVNMVERSPNLEEVVYTQVREDIIDDVREHLAHPWVEWATRRWCRHDVDGGGRPRHRIRVYIQTVWHRPILSRCDAPCTPFDSMHITENGPPLAQSGIHPGCGVGQHARWTHTHL